MENKGLKIHFSRETNPNAFSIGDGNLVINLDLLNILDSEGELVSVICHEASHFILKHREKSYKKNVENSTSKELKKEQREINNQKYNKQKRAEEFIKNIVYTRKSKSRNHEIQADSLGNVFFNKTNYNSKHLENLLTNLENSDKEKDSLVRDDFKKYFTTKNQKFIDEWLEVEDFSKYKYSKDHIFKWNIDSLKTHPDCKDRLAKIKSYNAIKDQSKNFILNESLFSSLKKSASFEKVFNLYYFKQYGFSLYETLKLLNKNNENQFLLKMVSNNLNELAKAKKDFKLNNYIPRIKPKEQSTSEQLFYNFINNLTQSEIDRIANYYKDLTTKK